MEVKCSPYSYVLKFDIQINFLMSKRLLEQKTFNVELFQLAVTREGSSSIT